MEKHFIIQLLDKTFHYTTIGKHFPWNYWKQFHYTTIGKKHFTIQLLEKKLKS